MQDENRSAPSALLDIFSEFRCVTRSGARGVVRVIASGELDLASVSVLDAELRALNGEVKVLILDLSGVTFMDSAGLHSILRCRTRASERDQTLMLVPGRDQVQRLFELAGYESGFEFLPART